MGRTGAPSPAGESAQFRLWVGPVQFEEEISSEISSEMSLLKIGQLGEVGGLNEDSKL